MGLKIVFSTFLLMVAVSLPIATALKCYTCEHLGRPEDNDCLTLKNLEPTLCSQQVAQRSLPMAIPNEIRRVYEVDIPPNGVQNSDWSCTKTEFIGLNGRTNYTIRSCQIGKNDMANFCDSARTRLRSNNNNQPAYNVQFCDECQKDACNGASTMKISFPILAIFILASYYLKA